MKRNEMLRKRTVAFRPVVWMCILLIGILVCMSGCNSQEISESGSGAAGQHDMETTQGEGGTSSDGAAGTGEGSILPDGEGTQSGEDDFLGELAGELETEAEAETEPLFPFLNFSGVGSTIFYTAEKEKIFEFGSALNMPYEGEEISLIVRNEFTIKDIDNPARLKSATVLVFLLNNGIPQTFYWGDAEEETLYTTFQATYVKAEDERYYWVPGEEGDYDDVVLTLDEVEEKMYYPFRFTPAEVSYGENNTMTLIMMKLQNQHFANSRTQCSNSGSGIQFCITAASPEDEITREVTVPVCGELADYKRKEGDGDSYGVAITEKMTNGEQLKINTSFTSDEQLYAAYSAYRDVEEDTELMLFAFMDGKPLYTFDGSWYCTMYVDPGELYEIPLDMSQIPSGEHLIGIVELEVERDGLRDVNNEEHRECNGVWATIYNVTVP